MGGSCYADSPLWKLEFVRRVPAWCLLSLERELDVDSARRSVFTAASVSTSPDYLPQHRDYWTACPIIAETLIRERPPKARRRAHRGLRGKLKNDQTGQ